MDKKPFTKKYVMFIMILTALSAISLEQSYAAVFNVYTVVCAPAWYCTAYDYGDCGTRTCIDTNGCGSNLDKPVEYLECEKSGGGGSGSGGAYIPLIQLLPKGYFTLNTDMIKVTIEQGIVVQKIISINSSEPGEYVLEILHPSSYTRGTDFISTTSDTKYIEGAGDFNIIIDSRDILIGTYVIPIKISNKDYSETIGLTIDVIPANNIDIEVSLDSKIKNLGIDTEILTFTKVRGLQADENVTLKYIILDPKGGILSDEELIVGDASRVEHKVAIPTSIGEGYYTLSVKVIQNNNTYVKSEQFTILTPNRYMPVIESPEGNIRVWLWIIIIIAAVITLFNTGLFYKSYTPKHRISRRVGGWRPQTDFVSGIREKFRAMIERNKEKKMLDTEHRMELLKKSYEGGFISQKEYHDIARRYGYNIGISPVEIKVTDKEAVEAAMKRHLEEQARREDIKSKKEEKEEKKIPVSLSTAINIPVQKEPETSSQDIKTNDEAHEPAGQGFMVEEKKNILEAPETERTISGSIGGAISHMFAQSIIDKKAHHDQAFILNNHERFYCIRDLMDALPDMSEHSFEYHTQHGRNDFANWIGDVFQYYDIAEEIRNAKTRSELVEILKRYA